jgi:hypothetical protein
MAASPGAGGRGFITPSILPPGPAARFEDTPVVFAPAGVVDPPDVGPVDAVEAEPDELAVPAELVPGAVGTFEAFPAPLGSLSELFSPPALAGPLGTPLTPAVPAPAEPAFGDPAALFDPAVGPLAAPVAPPAEAPPDDPPPAPPPPPPEPPPPPPPLCAYAANGHISANTIISLWGDFFMTVALSASLH